jgi:hypothetical protein
MMNWLLLLIPVAIGEELLAPERYQCDDMFGRKKKVRPRAR